MSQSVEPNYDFGVVRYFAIATIVWGVVGMGVGLLLAAQLAWPSLNFDIPWLSYGRLRPLHTNAVIFAFGGCALMASALYIVQRTCYTALVSRPLAWFVFWGWQLVIVSAVITLPLGITSSKEYAELGMAYRHTHCTSLGEFWHCIFWHHCQTRNRTYLCR